MAGIGNAFRLTGTFTQNGVLTDPAGAVTLKITSPLGVVTTVTAGFIHSTGVYAYDFYPTMGGIWWEEWSSAAGAGQADTVRPFVVEGPTSYCTVQDLRDYGITAPPADDLVADRIEIASRIVDDYCIGHSPFGSSLRTVEVNDVRDQLVILPQPFNDIIQVTVNGSVLPQTITTVAALPAPTTTVFSVAPGLGASLSLMFPMYVGGAEVQPLSIAGDVVTLIAPMAIAPTAGQSVMQTTSFTIEPWGIRLVSAGFYGFAVDGAFGGYGAGWRGVGLPYGSRVEVTATFGFAVVPSVVREATRLVAARRLQAIGETLLDPRIQGLSVEGYSLRLESKHDGFASTGVREADRMLSRYRDPVLA